MYNRDQSEDCGRVEVPTAKANQKYADSLFTMLFQTKEDILALHRMLHPSEQITLDSIQLCTLKNVVINNRYNDLAYLAGERLIILMEHQTTKNPNMPLRLLLYLTLEYERIIREKKLDIFSEVLQPLPKPEFYVVYTGATEWEAEELKLSEAFGVTEKAIRSAIEDCMTRGILTEFLRERKKEVSRVLLDQCIEVDLVELARQRADREIQKAKQEAEQERQKAEQERRKAVGMLKEMNLTDAEIKSKFRASFGLTEEQAQALLNDYYNHQK